MKIIFDSEEQKDKFMDIVHEGFICPRELGLEDARRNSTCLSTPCITCWENSGVEMEVKDAD